MALRSENLLLRRYIDKAMVDLPAMPGVVLQVVQATEREEVSSAEVERLLSADPAITTKLLKVVNSAYFGLPRQITNISQTITILGMHQVRNLVMSIGVLNIMNSSSPRLMETQKEFWMHSFASATCAELIARAKGLPKKDTEAVFVSGLLHDIGRLFLLTMFNLPYKDVISQSLRSGEPIDSVEERILGATHAELGGLLAEKWNFPVQLVTLIRHHTTLPANEVEPMLYCVNLADAIANSVASPEIVGVYKPADPRSRAWLGANDKQFDELRYITGASVQKARELFGVL
jgi:HD-like signal output (HDOD) protein